MPCAQNFMRIIFAEENKDMDNCRRVSEIIQKFQITQCLGKCPKTRPQLKNKKYSGPRRRPLAYLLHHMLTVSPKPRLCINIRHYAPPVGSTAQRAAGNATHRAATSLTAARRCGVSEDSMSSFKSTTQNALC